MRCRVPDAMSRQSSKSIQWLSPGTTLKKTVKKLVPLKSWLNRSRPRPAHGGKAWSIRGKKNPKRQQPTPSQARRRRRNPSRAAGNARPVNPPDQASRGPQELRWQTAVQKWLSKAPKLHLTRPSKLIPGLARQLRLGSLAARAPSGGGGKSQPNTRYNLTVTVQRLNHQPGRLHPRLCQ